MPDLFSTGKPSRLQMGKLIMDGRHFTLTMPVVNVAEHKRIVQSSDICVLYVEISRTVAGKPEKQLLAVAVTGGTMRTLFVGKHGVFLDTDGNLFDARITDMVDQPVSIGEALKDPYFRFADFIGKQTEKMFNSRNAVIQKDLTKNFDPAAIPAKPGTPAGTPAAGGIKSANSAATLPDYRKGDMVNHKAFGKGMVTSAQKAGGDVMLEIAFDNVGTKRLMLKFAAAQLTKL
jgi:hypothetical protein